MMAIFDGDQMLDPAVAVGQSDVLKMQPSEKGDELFDRTAIFQVRDEKLQVGARIGGVAGQGIGEV